MDLLRQSNAATEKGVSRQAISLALNKGRLTAQEVDGVRFVVKDEIYEKFSPSPYGKPGRSGRPKSPPRVTTA